MVIPKVPPSRSKNKIFNSKYPFYPYPNAIAATLGSFTILNTSKPAIVTESIVVNLRDSLN